MKITNKGPKQLYMVVINMGGYVWNEIVALKKNNHEDIDGYWSKTGEEGFLFDEAPNYGLNKKDWCWEFITKDKKEAKTFLAGALAAKEFAKQWFS